MRRSVQCQTLIRNRLQSVSLSFSRAMGVLSQMIYIHNKSRMNIESNGLIAVRQPAKLH